MPMTEVMMPDYRIHSTPVRVPERDLVIVNSEADFTYLVDPSKRISILVTKPGTNVTNPHFYNQLSNMMTVSRMACDKRYPNFANIFLKYVGGIQ